MFTHVRAGYHQDVFLNYALCIPMLPFACVQWPCLLGCRHSVLDTENRQKHQLFAGTFLLLTLSQNLSYGRKPYLIWCFALPTEEDLGQCKRSRQE